MKMTEKIVSSMVDTQQVCIKCLTDEMAEPVQSDKTYRSNFYSLAMLTQGEALHNVDGCRLALKPYQLHFTVPGQVQYWESLKNAAGVIIHFSEPFFQNFLLNPDYLQELLFFRGRSENIQVILPEEQKPFIEAVFEKLLLEAEMNDLFGIDLVKVLMIQIFICINRLESQANYYPVNGYNYIILANFFKLIEKNVNALKLPKEYAALLYISPQHLNTICKLMTGKSTGELIRERKILEARRLMNNFDLSISQISDTLNFKDNSYFSKFFRKHTGHSPEEYRQLKMSIVIDSNPFKKTA